MLTKFKEICFGENISYIAPSWEEMGQVIFHLGKQIIKSKRKYDWIVSIAKGGWTWSRTLADFLDTDNLASVKAKLYSGIGQTAPELILEQSLPVNVIVKNKKILLFDDVTDSGKTFLEVKKYLKKLGAKKVETASLFIKPKSVIIPDFYACKTNAWIIFPHEIREFITLTKKLWKNLPKEKILKRYKKLELSQDQVRFFYNLE